MGKILPFRTDRTQNILNVFANYRHRLIIEFNNFMIPAPWEHWNYKCYCHCWSSWLGNLLLNYAQLYKAWQKQFFKAEVKTRPRHICTRLLYTYFIISFLQFSISFQLILALLLSCSRVLWNSFSGLSHHMIM